MSPAFVVSGPIAGAFDYSYNVTNDPSSSENLFAFVLSTDGMLTLVTSPIGWTADTVSSPGFITWTSGDQTTDLPPSSSDVFGFSGSLAPGEQLFLGLASDPISGIPTGDFDSGLTMGPSSAAALSPEPSSLAMMLAGLAALAFARSRIRRLDRSRNV